MTFSKGILPRRAHVSRVSAAVTALIIPASLGLYMLSTNPSFARQGLGGGYSTGKHYTHKRRHRTAARHTGQCHRGVDNATAWACGISCEARESREGMQSVAVTIGTRMEQSGQSVQGVVFGGAYAPYCGKYIGSGSPYRHFANAVMSSGWRAAAGSYAHSLRGYTEFRTARKHGEDRGRIIDGNVFLAPGAPRVYRVARASRRGIVSRRVHVARN